MRVFVIGAQGQLARALSSQPTSAAEVIAIGRPDVDIRDPDTIATAIARLEPSIVINVAAFTAVDQAETNPDEAFAINAEGAGTVAKCCHIAGVPLIHISTDYVFDRANERAYVEEDPVAPINTYGRSKLEGERLVSQHCARHLIIRTSWVFSPFGHNFFTTMLRLADTRKQLRVVDDQVGCPTYAPHLAEGLLKLASHICDQPIEAPFWGLYHLAASGSTSWYGLARAIFASVEKRGGMHPVVEAICTAEYPTPARRPMNSQLDCSKIQAQFGIGLPHWIDGTDECVGRILSGHSRQKSL